MNEPKDIVKAETAVSVSPVEKAVQVLNSGASPEMLDKILDMQLKWENNQERKAFNASMVDVHQNMPLVVKTLENAQTRSKYASLDAIICKSKEVYTKYGFSIVFYEGDTDKEGHVRICADVIHREGYKETYHYDMPLDGKGIKGNVNMTAIHGKSSAVAYGRRYLMCMIWNIPTGDDDDGNKAGASAEYIDDKQLSTIRDYVDNKGIPESNLLKYAGVETLEEILKSDFDKVMSSIQVTLSKRGKSGEVVDVNNE